MSWRSEPLANLFHRLGPRPYDRMYRRGAPWEGGPRDELVGLLESGRLTPQVTGGRRALDLGCGSGADSILLADSGFEVTGVDFSAVALQKARSAAGSRRDVTFVEADLLELPESVVATRYDLVFDGGTVDDLPAARRRDVARTVTSLTGSGAVFVMWCFCAEWDELPWVSVSGPSRLLGAAVPPGEVGELYGQQWDVQRLPEPTTPYACFWMIRR